MIVQTASLYFGHACSKDCIQYNDEDSGGLNRGLYNDVYNGGTFQRFISITMTPPQ